MVLKKERFIASKNPEQLAIPFEIDEQEVVAAIESVKQQIIYECEKSAKKHQGRLALQLELFQLETTITKKCIKIIFLKNIYNGKAIS